MFKTSLAVALIASGLITPSFAAEPHFRTILPETLAVRPAFEPFAAALSQPLPEGPVQAGAQFGSDIVAEGGKPPYRATLISGELPQGLTLTDLRLSGNLMGSSSGFQIRVSDSANPPNTVDLSGDARVFEPLVIGSVAASVSIGRLDEGTLSFPSFTKGLPPYERGYEGALPNGVTYDEATGNLEYDRVPVGTSGNIRFWVEDATGRRVHSNYFRIVSAGVPSMRLTLPGGYRYTFVGWTAQPPGIVDYYMQPGGAFSMKINDPRCNNGRIYVLIYGSTDNGNTVSTSGQCNGNSQGAREVWTEKTGLPVPVVVQDVRKGNVDAFKYYYPADATWTKVTY